MDFELLEKQDINFELVSNRIAFYYKEVFNIEILNLFYKRNLKKMSDKNIKLSNYLEVLPLEVFDFYILIKDNNKKVFKYKLLKATYDGKKYRDKENRYVSFLEYLYFFVDEYLCRYCQKHYLGKHNTKQINMILEKDKKVNNDYHEWIMRNYKKSN